VKLELKLDSKLMVDDESYVTH